MKKHTVCLLLMGASLLSMAQSVESSKFKTVFGSKYELPKKHYDLGFFGSPEEGLVQLSYRIGSDLTIQRFDSKLNVNKSEVIDIKKMPASFVNDDFRKLNGKYWWFYSTWDKKAEKEHLFAQQIDVKGGKLTGNAIDLVTATKLEGSLIATGFYKFAKANKYQMAGSQDKSKLLVLSRLATKTTDDSKSIDEFLINVFDHDLKKVWSKQVKMPYTEEMMDNIDYTIDNDGNVYLLAKVYEGKRKEKTKDDAPNYHYEMLRYATGGELKKIPVTLEDKFINELYISAAADGNIVIAGYYSNAVFAGSSDGIFLVKIDKDGTAKKYHKGYYEFPSEILKQYQSARAKKKMEKAESKGDKDIEAYSLDMRNIILDEDGSVLIAGEEYYVHSYTVYSGRSTYTRYVYYYNDILAMKIGANGEMEWCRKIPKRQKGGAGRGSMSFELVPFNGNYYFFYTDNVKNLSIKPDQVPAYHGDGAGGFLTYSTIDAKGNITKAKMFDYREKDINLWPADFEKVGDNQIINRAFDGRESKVLLITLQ